MSATACRVSSDLAQHQHEVSEAELNQQAFSEHIADTMKTEGLDDLLMRGISAETAQQRTELAFDQSIEILGDILATSPKDLAATVAGWKLWIEKQVIESEGGAE